MHLFKLYIDTFTFIWTTSSSFCVKLSQSGTDHISPLFPVFHDTKAVMPYLIQMGLSQGQELFILKALIQLNCQN